MKYNLLLPIAGKAQRFLDQGYNMPKPLIMAKTRQVIDWAMDSIKTDDCNIIFVVRQEHIQNFSIDDILRKKFGQDVQIIVAEHDTNGSVSTCLLAEKIINNDIPLIIYTPDVHFEATFNPAVIDKNTDGLILTFKANSPAHSYVALDENDHATRTAENQVISSNAAVGVYYFKTGKMFVNYAKELIDQNIRTKNEFYLCPIYNLLINDGLKIKIEQVEKMHVLGTPAELEFFVDNVAYRFGERPIGLCCDHSGFHTKEAAKKILIGLNIPYVDFGCEVEKDIDYNEFVLQACKAIDNKICDFAFGFCRTGQGVNILANHQGNIRAALVFNDYMAEMARRHNCANFFSIPSKYVDEQMLKQIIEALKGSTFDGGRHMTRMKEV